VWGILPAEARQCGFAQRGAENGWWWIAGISSWKSIARGYLGASVKKRCFPVLLWARKQTHGGATKKLTEGADSTTGRRHWAEFVPIRTGILQKKKGH